MYVIGMFGMIGMPELIIIAIRNFKGTATEEEEKETEKIEDEKKSDS
ncbi:MAG: hypothetical protein JRI53_01395 [Deltaproteobacteria bacterium]|nr:hypothetical protein [Deltaproteobacteria bacterium]